MKTLTVIHASRFALGAIVLSLSLLLPVTGHAELEDTIMKRIITCSDANQLDGTCVKSCTNSRTKAKAVMCLGACGTAAKGCIVVQ